MGKTARNSLKGYTYQQSVFILFLAIMDTERNISKIEVEALNTENFDDMYFECISDVSHEGLSYRVQVKNYPNTIIGDIKVSDDIVSIKGNKNKFAKTDNNILIVNTNCIETDDVFMGLPCIMHSNIIIIPLTPETIAKKVDNMFQTYERELQIIHVADDIVENAKFAISIKELPAVIQMSNNLENETVILRNVPDELEHKITFIEGKPGVGKSHYVNELSNKYPEAVIYRFWTGPQDIFKNSRLRFETFISELGIKVYGAAKKVTIDELVNTIQKDKRLIVIDGLDHVENYNPQQLEQFIDFIDKLANSRVVVLSRPLRNEISWRKESLLEWTFDETRIYLRMAYDISDYQVQRKIFDISGGYPIITYYIAEEYRLTNKIAANTHIAGINEYYDTLFVNNDRPSCAMGVFAVGNCFFTFKELQGFFMKSGMYDVICEFIQTHPYLFKVIFNRVSLIHDSFNTYLRTKINLSVDRKEEIILIIRESLLKGSVEYMARMESFSFDEKFYSTMLKMYSNTEEFKRLILSTRDFDSINRLYIHLQSLLEKRSDVLNIYEYYSFAMLLQVATRNDLLGCDSLVYQMLSYMQSHEGIEDNIFSSDYIWQVYLTCNNREKHAERYLSNMNCSDSQFYSLIDNINEDKTFYTKKYRKRTFDEVAKILNNKTIEIVDRENTLTDYLINIWIYDTTKEELFKEFQKYVYSDENNCVELKQKIHAYGINGFRVEDSLYAAKYRLHELGFFEKDNKFKKGSLCELIMDNAPAGSFKVVTLASSYLKLANFEKREVDISSLGYCWAMHYAHKDYSVFTIDEALIAFEKNSLIDWTESFYIIQNLMKQSERGMPYLLTWYINKKGPKFASEINKRGHFVNDDYNISFWELSTEIYEIFSSSEIVDKVMKLLSNKCRMKTVSGTEILNILASKHIDLVLDKIKQYDHSVISPHNDYIPMLQKKNIKYSEANQIELTKYEPLQYGNIREEDFDYIAEQKIDYLTIAQYADGWHSCLPFIDVFSLYPKEDIQKDYKAIIHNAMFARVSNDTYIGNWRFLIGNIPAFLMKYEIDVDWRKLHDIFNDFLSLSLIKR